MEQPTTPQFVDLCSQLSNFSRKRAKRLRKSSSPDAQVQAEELDSFANLLDNEPRLVERIRAFETVVNELHENQPTKGLTQ